MKIPLTINGKSMLHDPTTGQCEMFERSQKPCSLKDHLLAEIKDARTLDDLEQFRLFYKPVTMPALERGNPKAHDQVKEAWQAKKKQLTI